MNSEANLVEALTAAYKAAAAAQLAAGDQVRAIQDRNGDNPTPSQIVEEEILMDQLREVGHLAHVAQEALRHARAR